MSWLLIKTTKLTLMRDWRRFNSLYFSKQNGSCSQSKMCLDKNKIYFKKTAHEYRDNMVLLLAGTVVTMVSCHQSTGFFLRRTDVRPSMLHSRDPGNSGAVTADTT